MYIFSIRTEVVSSCVKGLFKYLHLSNSSVYNIYTSTLLKSDQWLRESHHVDHGVRGAINFRRIQVPGTKVYALGQPTIEAIDEVVSRVKKAHPTSSKIVWITLREEPIVYINGAPYCLRRENFSLRNMKGKVFSSL
jgi:Inositol hexakisphosphate